MANAIKSYAIFSVSQFYRIHPLNVIIWLLWIANVEKVLISVGTEMITVCFIDTSAVCGTTQVTVSTIFRIFWLIELLLDQYKAHLFYDSTTSARKANNSAYYSGYLVIERYR